MAFHIIEGIVRLVDSLGNAITSTLNTGSKQSLDVHVANTPIVKVQDGAGNAVTSQASSSQRALDVGIAVSGAQVDPRQVRALTSADVVTALQSGTWNIVNVSGTVSLPTGASTSAKQDTIITDLGTINTSIGTTNTNLGTIDTDIKNTQPRKLQDGSGNAITSQANSSQRALDVGVNVLGVQIDPRSNALDQTVTGTITAAGQTVQIAVGGYASRGIVITGTWAGVIVCESSSDGGTTWNSVSIRDGALGADMGIVIPQIAASMTANGSYKPNNSGGISHLRVRASSWTLGSASITLLNSSSAHSFTFGQHSIIQSVSVLNSNSSTINILAGGTFLGGAESTLGVAGIQVSLFTDQNCLIYVDQSPDNTPHWDITDSYQYYANTSFGMTVQAINSYVRVRIVNQNATTATTSFRLQTCLCPIVEAVPRSLNSRGNLKTAIQSIEDNYGFEVENTPTGEMRVVTPVRLVGATFEGTTVDNNFWTVPTPAASATVTQANTIITLATGGTANGACQLHSVRRARFGEVAALQVRIVAKLSTGVTSNKRRWGVGYGATMPTITEGAYFYLNETTFGVGILTGGVETPINSGSFNGVLGTGYTPSLNYEIYEIYYSGVACYFVIDDKILHSIPLITTPLTATLNHYLYTDNVNSNGIISNNTLSMRIAAIRRLGTLLSQQTNKYQSGTTTGVICKRAAGNLNQLIISGITNGSIITLYDGTSTGGTIIWSSGTMNAGNANAFQAPVSIDFKGLPFHNGLFFTITGSSCNTMFLYE